MEFTHNLERPGVTVPVAYETDGMGDVHERMIYAHYFSTGSNADWYVIEYDPIQDAIFGWAEVIPGCGELGWASLPDLEDVCIQVPLKFDDEIVALIPCHIERDRHWVSRPLNQVLKDRLS